MVVRPPPRPSAPAAASLILAALLSSPSPCAASAFAPAPAGRAAALPSAARRRRRTPIDPPAVPPVLPPPPPLRSSSVAAAGGEDAGADAPPPPPSAAAASASAAVDADVEPSLRRSLSRMERVMTSEFFDSDPSLRRVRSQIVRSVEVRESSIPGAGMGLFVTRNLKSGSVVSFYPAHALGVESGGGRQTFAYLSESDAEHFLDHPCSESGYLQCTDQPIFDRPSALSEMGRTDVADDPMYLDVNPNRDVDGAWVSHYINDGATVTTNSEGGVLDYYDSTGRARNCVHVPFGPSPIIATVATRKVKKGEELFTTYGCTYWLGVLLGLRGEDGIGMTPRVRSRIRESAEDLFRGMMSVGVAYAGELEALRAGFDSIKA